MSGMAVRARLSGWMAAAIMAAFAPPGVAQSPGDGTAYLDAARRADAIGDPLARCLAYPDLPGNLWPAGHAAALCRLAHAHPITLAELRAHVDAGRIAQLDALFKRDLERHFTEPDANEIIHRGFDAIDASPAAADLTERWIGRAPGSAYANAARARHLRLQAAGLRGPGQLSDLRPEQAAAVTKLTDRAFDLLGRAIRLEPRLIQVDVELAELGFLLGRADIVADAERHAASLAPGCAALAQGLMGMMWRQGEFGRFLMREYAAGLKAQLGRSAQLAEAVALPSVLEGRDLLTEGKRKEAALLLEEAARQGASSETLALLAKAMPDLPGRARSERLQVLLQAGRFGADDVATGLERGRALVRAGEHEWALRALERTLAREPGKWEVHTLLALANGYLKRHAEAEAHLLKVMQHPPARESALHSLMTTMREAGEWSKAAHYAALVVREQPHALDAWQILGVARFRSGDRAGARAAFESLLHRFDQGDPTMAPQLYWTRRAIAWLQDPDGAESRPEGL